MTEQSFFSFDLETKTSKEFAETVSRILSEQKVVNYSEYFNETFSYVHIVREFMVCRCSFMDGHIDVTYLPKAEIFEMYELIAGDSHD